MVLVSALHSAIFTFLNCNLLKFCDRQNMAFARKLAILPGGLGRDEQ